MVLKGLIFEDWGKRYNFHRYENFASQSPDFGSVEDTIYRQKRASCSKSAAGLLLCGNQADIRGGGGGCIFIYSRSPRQISFEINCNDN